MTVGKIVVAAVVDRGSAIKEIIINERSAISN